MGNSSLFRFNGAIRRSQHGLGKSRNCWVRRLAGIAGMPS